ncbi:MAG: Macrolide export ATP-binding/permease protein MacB [Stenotrophomonas maltophilia]|uniref:Macrolide export ATP-binding/permease protein MacB n=1 Tax=Stenotrophomonas maltophilia TaxID=40324 RepID=A0A7V8FG38_STEMA|nr:MAG: Macrolide export ATP-binding/permease protein MacB [Stenotrophomonas maltophilia]
MYAYYFRLALRSFRRNKVLTALMVIAIALGIGASMTTLTVFHALSGDPIPQKSDRLFYVQLDPRPQLGAQPGEEPEDQLTRFDAEALLREKRAKHQALMTGGGATIEPDNSTLRPFTTDARYTSSYFFPMFDTPFLYGQGWKPSDDDARGRVVVISRALNQKLYEGNNSVGKPLRLDGHTFTIVGVLDAWNPNPHFYDLATGRYCDVEDLYLPFSTFIELKMDRSGNMNCFGRKNESDEQSLTASCAWMQYWVELDTPAQAADYRAYLENYSSQQRAAGRFERAPNVKLRNVMQWLDYKQVVPGDVRLQLWLALGFLLVCLINTVGLLLTKFLRRSGEIGVRRALGASRGQIFLQSLIEAGTVGVAGSILGLGLAALGLYAVRQQPVDYAKLATLDGPMLLLALGITLVASLLAGFLPALRAMQVTPAIQLKSQ